VSNGKGATLLSMRVREVGSELHGAHDEPVPTGSWAFSLGRGLITTWASVCPPAPCAASSRS
jgi:hypothetical protein